MAEFTLSDSTYPFVGVSAAEHCEVALQKKLPRGEGRWVEYFSVYGTDPDRILELAAASDRVEPRLVNRYDAGGLFEFIVDGFCPARDLALLGAIPQEVYSKDGDGEIVTEIPPQIQPTAVIKDFLNAHPTADLATRRTIDRRTPLFTPDDLKRAVDERFTSRQQEVLRTAVGAGYYDAFGDTTLREIGDELGISASTVSQHLKAAERKLVSTFLKTLIPMAVKDGIDR